VARGPQVVRGGTQAISVEKALQKWRQTLNDCKIYLYIFVLKLPFLVGLQQKVGELIISINFLSLNQQLTPWRKNPHIHHRTHNSPPPFPVLS
jgi:hypothetical protein